MTITREKCLNLWNNAPIKKFLDYHPKEVDTSRADGVVLTEDWARVMYLLQEYSGGGYWSATLGIMAFWRALGCRCNVPYGNEIGNLLRDQQMYNYNTSRNVPALLKEISKIVDDDLDQNGNLSFNLRELGSILGIIKEKTGFKLEKTEFESKEIQQIVPTHSSLRKTRSSFVDYSSLQGERVTFN